MKIAGIRAAFDQMGIVDKLDLAAFGADHLQRIAVRRQGRKSRAENIAGFQIFQNGLAAVQVRADDGGFSFKKIADAIRGICIKTDGLVGGKRLFGGSRTVAGADFNSLDELLAWYCGGNEKIAENLRGFFKNDGITLAALCWNGKADRHVRILPDGKIENI